MVTLFAWQLRVEYDVPLQFYLRIARAFVRKEAILTMQNIIDEITKEQLRTDIPDFRPGDTLKVHVKITEGTHERIQVFEGVVIKRHGGGISATFTVRKISYSVGVERAFPVNSPKIDKIEVVRHGKVRRAKLYYLRNLRGKKARIKSR